MMMESFGMALSFGQRVCVFDGSEDTDSQEDLLKNPDRLTRNMAMHNI